MEDMCLLILCLLFNTAANSAHTPCVLCVDEASPAQLAAIEIRLYTGSTVDNYTSVLVRDSLELLEEMDNSKPTALYIFGWIGYPNQDIIQAVIRGANVPREHDNFLLLNWEKIAYTEYTSAARSVEGVGYTLTMVLNNLVAGGSNTTAMKVIGHSLGAPVAGFTGRCANFTIPRITVDHTSQYGLIKPHLPMSEF